jgi:putative tryptophan/tyrosine transport system substrate-binding protein
MRRRAHLGFMAAALAWPAHTMFAQASNPPRIGWMWSGRSANDPNEVKGFRQGLRDLGYVEGENIVVEYRFGEGSEDRLDDFAAEFVRMRLDVLVGLGIPAVLALQATKTTIPIVALSGDLVADHIVASMARPGGNITGISVMQGAVGANLAGKRLQLMKQAMPTITRIGFLFNPKFSARNLGEVERVAPTLGLVLRSSAVRLIEDVKPAITSLKSEGVEAVDVDAAPPLIAYQPETVRLALDLQLPTASEQPEFAEDGGLLSYGPSIFTAAQRQAYFVDRILNGAKPTDLPVEQPAQFELDINLKTAKALGITIPESLLVQADRVIE